MMGDWIEWNGGECPLPADVMVFLRFRDGHEQKEYGKACSYYWKHDGDNCDIIAYRLAEPASVPPVPPAPGMPDLVNAPPHYKQGAIECIDAIRSALTAEEFRGHCKANAIKYIWRESHKGGDESIRKAIWYLTEMLK